MHIHARSKAEQSAVGQSKVKPRPALLNSDLAQQAGTACLSALSALKWARAGFLSALVAPEQARMDILRALAALQIEHSDGPSPMYIVCAVAVNPEVWPMQSYGHVQVATVWPRTRSAGHI